jgi:hypothetical protein
LPESTDPPNKVLIDAVLAALKHGVVFLVDNDMEDASDVERLVKKTERLAFEALVETFGRDSAKKFFVKSENAWILRTTFGGWVFFYPIEALTPDTSLAEVGSPEFVYWPDAKGSYARVPWMQWIALREGGGNAWRPPTMARGPGPRSVWERLRDP